MNIAPRQIPKMKSCKERYVYGKLSAGILDLIYLIKEHYWYGKLIERILESGTYDTSLH
jgi:hypothetical protein